MYSESRTEKKHNEDVIYASDNLWIVCDAASGLTKTDWMHQGSDAAWFSHFLVDFIVNALKPETNQSAPSCSLSEILASACQQASTIFPPCSELEMPSAAIAVLYRNVAQKRFEYLVLGDCVLLAELVNEARSGSTSRLVSEEKKTGSSSDEPALTTHKITDPTIAHFDGMALDFMKGRSQKLHEPFLAQRPLANEILIANRQKKNQPDGYAIADCTIRWAGHELSGTFSLEALKRAALYSDGFDQLQDFLQADQIIHSDQAFLNFIFDHQNEVLDLLYQKQNQDSSCEIIPRLKLRDDTSLILVDFPTRSAQ